VGPLAVNRFARRTRRRLAGVLSVLALASVIAVHHGDPSMGAMHHEPGMAMTMTVCLGALVALGAAVVAVAFGTLRLGRWDVPALRAPRPMLRADPLRGLARAGPPGQSLLGVWRI
jgi:hypothetical protein